MLLTAMRWLYRRKTDVFENLGYTWEDLLDHFKVGMAKSIASFHVALAVPESVVRAYVKLIRYAFISYLPYAYAMNTIPGFSSDLGRYMNGREPWL